MAARKALKIAGISVAVAVMAVAAGLGYIYTQFDAPRIKAELARIVQEEKQRTLRIDGDLELSLWPSLGVRLGKLSLSEHGSAQEFAHIDKAHVSVAVMPLLSRRIVVDAVAVDGAAATLVRRKDGTLNIADLLAKDEKERTPVRFDIASINLRDIRLDWRDEQSGRRLSIGGFDLSTGRVQGDTGAKTFDVDALKLATKGEAAGGRFDIQVEAPRLALSPAKSSIGKAMLEASLEGAKRKLKAKLSLSGIEGTAQALKADQLALELDAQAGQTQLKGRADSPLSADLGRRRISLDSVRGNLQVAAADMPIKRLELPIEGALHADLAASSAGGRLDTRFDESKVALKFDVVRFTPLSLAFDLDIDRLDVDKYLPRKAPGKEGAKDQPGAAQDGKLDFSALKGLDVNGTVSIGSLKFANVQASKVKLKIKGDGGRLDIAPHSANLYGGTANGALSLDANRNAVALRENLVGIDIQPLMKDALDKDMLEGRGSISIDIAGQGDSVASIKRTLDGSAALALRDGAVRGINLAKSFRDLKMKFSSRQDAVQPAQATEKTDFSELMATFKITDGIARNEDLALKSPFLRLSGSGSVDIAKGTVDYLTKVSVVTTTAGQGGKELEHLRGLTVPVRASGPAEQLSYRIEFAAVAQEAVKAKVEEKKEQIKERVQEKLLKGLFGK